jgi:prepilin-type N-terminal cleavage/methylation domain-containing protein
MKHTESGFSIVEVLVAIVLLSIGLLALAQNSGAVTTMIARGKQDSQAAMFAQAKVDSLRLIASTPPKCSSLTSGSTNGPTPGTTATWTIASPNAESRTVRMIVNYRTAKKTRADTSYTTLGCL